MNQRILRPTVLAVSVLASSAVMAGEIRGLRENGVIPGQYIVVYKSESQVQAMGIAAHEASPAALAASHGKRHKLKIKHTFAHALRGAVVEGKDADAQALADDATVAYVEADRVIRIGASQSGATWGLDRIDQTNLPLNSTYTYPDQGGQGVRAYIIDTGINTSHNDFTGRTASGYSAINDGRGTSDCQGHGTHVASTTAGTTWGVAKKATVIPVRVLDCNGSGSNSGVIAGINWVAQNAVKPAVANMSLGGGASQAVDDAIASLTNSGVVAVVAAGNDSSNACNYSPARAPSAITVGSTTSSDAMSSFSNYGSCVDIYGPGSNITAALHSNNTGSQTMSGTSMASPHVAGVAALYLGANPSASVNAVTSALVSNATNGKVTGIPSGVNKLLNINWLNGGGTTPDPVVTLTNGTPVANLSFSAQQSRYFTLQVPAGASNLKFVTSGGSGDVDLYVKFGSQPTTTTADCKSEGSTNAETCTISNVQAGTYHVLAYGYSASSGVSLTGSYSTGGGGDGTITLTNGTAVSVATATGASKMYKITVPAGRSSLTIQSSGGTGDLDLYVQRGSLPTRTSYLRKSEGSTNSETITISSPTAGDYYIMAYGYSAVSGASLRATY